MMDGSLITHSPPQVRLGPPQPRKTEPEHEENPLAISFASTLLHIAKAFSYPPRKQHVVFGFHRAAVVYKDVWQGRGTGPAWGREEGQFTWAGSP